MARLSVSYSDSETPCFHQIRDFWAGAAQKGFMSAFDIRSSFMTVVVQTQVLLPNRPGELEKLSHAIAEANVNIHAIMLREDAAGASVRLVVDKPKVARKALEQHGLTVTESKLIAVLLPDKPGELWKVSAVLAAHNANIQYSYTSAKPIHGKPTILIAIGGVPPERAAEILQKEGYECIDHATLVGTGSAQPPE